MKRKFSKYLNIQLVASLIAGFSLLYLLSYTFVIGDLSGGSSLQIKKDLLKKQNLKCFPGQNC